MTVKHFRWDARLFNCHIVFAHMSKGIRVFLLSNMIIILSQDYIMLHSELNLSINTLT